MARGSDEIFGDMQLIFVLDARQLPPVEDADNGDLGQYCFESRLWSKAS